MDVKILEPDDIEEVEELACWMQRQLDPYWKRVDHEMDEWKSRPE